MKVRTAITVVLLATTSPGAVSSAAAQTPSTTEPPREGCQGRDQWGQCVVEVPVPVGTSGPDRDGDDGQGNLQGPVPTPACPWVIVPAGRATGENLRTLFPEAPDDAVLQVRDCAPGADNNTGNPGGGQFGSGARWVAGGPPPPGPPPATAVALMLYARAQALMVAPHLATNPPVGAAAVVDIPVFVAVENWQDEISDSECVLGVCVEMTASPSLEFAPGEPQAPVIQCNPPGSRFDAALGGAAAQASVPGACAYAYGQRTGVAGRPEQWPGDVTVRWSVSWTSNVGVSGSFPDLTFSTGAPRVVDEVQTVVADSS